LRNAIIRVVVFTLFYALFILAGCLFASVLGNVKYEVTEDRVVVSCIDGSSPTIRTMPRPNGKGYIAVVVCEKGQQ